MGLTNTTPPEVEPISLATAKAHLRITHDNEDNLIRTYIAAARRWTEDFTHRAIINQNWTFSCHRFPYGRGHIRLPLGRCQAVQQIRYFDVDGNLQTLRGPTSGSPVGTDYQEDLTSDDGAILIPPISDDWPSVESERLTSVFVDFVPGYGADAEDVPAALVTAILYRLTDVYEFRGAIDGSGTKAAKDEVNAYVLALA